MAKFKKFRAPKIATVIGTGTSIKGDVTFSGGLHIDGGIKGNVIAEPDGQSALTLSEKGAIEGDVRVPNIILNGTVIGDVYASERVELAPNARVTGTVYYKLLEMAMGAEVNGQLVHAEEIEPRRLGYDGEASGASGAELEAEPIES
jgi:cytoskeletal protein CcmA (bactofilin family)